MGRSRGVITKGVSGGFRGLTFAQQEGVNLNGWTIVLFYLPITKLKFGNDHFKGSFVIRFRFGYQMQVRAQCVDGLVSRGHKERGFGGLFCGHHSRITTDRFVFGILCRSPWLVVSRISTTLAE